MQNIFFFWFLNYLKVNSSIAKIIENNTYGGRHTILFKYYPKTIEFEFVIIIF